MIGSEKMETMPCDKAYSRIMDLKNLNLEALPQIYKCKLTDMKTYGKTHQLYYIEMNVENFSSDCLKKVIGKNGCYFKLTTEIHDLDFIWHDRENKKIIFYGPKSTNVINAYNLINSRIDKNKAN